jgi:hypothetical protein
VENYSVTNVEKSQVIQKWFFINFKNIFWIQFWDLLEIVWSVQMMEFVKYE